MKKMKKPARQKKELELADHNSNMRSRFAKQIIRFWQESKKDTMETSNESRQ